MRKRRFTKGSVATEIALSISLMMGLVVLILAISNHRILRNSELELSGQQVDRALELLDPYLRTNFDILHLDLGVLSQIFAIKGILRAEQNDGFDPVDGLTLEVLENRLLQTLTLVFSTRPDYSQMSFIDFSEQGREIVRIDRLGENSANARLNSDTYSQLVDKSQALNEGESAFIQGSMLTDSAQNQEFSDAPITALAPVFGSNGELFGAVTITSDVGAIASKAMRGFPWTWSIELFARSENQLTITSSKAGSDQGSSFESDPVKDNSLANLDFLEFSRETTIGVSPNEESVLVTATVPVKEMVAQATLLTQGNLLFSGGLLLLVFPLGFVIGKRIAAPLLRLDRAIQAQGMENSDMRLPVERNDEIGKIARSFMSLAENLQLIQTNERRTHNKLQAVFDQSIDAIVTIDSQGLIRSVNKATVELFGYHSSELIGKNSTILMTRHYKRHHDKSIKNYNETSVANFVGTTQEVQGINKNGDILELELSISEIRFEDELVAYCGLLRDISERKAVEIRLKNFANELATANKEYKKLNADLDSANEDLKNFTYIVSHDLKAPLINIQGFAAQLEVSVAKINQGLADYSTDSLPDDIAELMNVRVPKATRFISSSATKMQTQLDAILEVSRLGRFELSPEPVDLHEAFRSVFETHLGEDWRANVSMNLESIPPIMIDKKAFNIVVTNLCSNAIKYQVADRKLQLSVIAELTDDNLKIEVQDNGRGIDAKELETIFELFRRCGRPDTQGEGVGLTYTKTLVARMEGEISCFSTLGEGTTFILNLPIKHCRQESEAA